MIEIKYVCDECEDSFVKKLFKGKQLEFIDSWDGWKYLPKKFDIGIGGKSLLCKKCKKKQMIEFDKKYPDAYSIG